MAAGDETLGAWYDSVSDLWGDLTNVFGTAKAAGKVLTNTGTAGQNAVNNAQNATSYRIDGTTVLLGALAVGALLLVLDKRR